MTNKEKNIEIVEENLETIEANKLNIKFNKKLFTICAGVGLVATGVGIAGIVVFGPVVAPVVTTAVGAVTTVTNLVFKSGEKEEDKILDYLYDENVAKYQKIK